MVNFKHLGKLSSNKFLWVVEKRIKKSIRKNYDLKKDVKLVVFDDLSEYVLRSVIKTPFEMIRKSKSFFGVKNIDETIFENKKLGDFLKKNKAFVVLPWTLDHEIILFMKNMSKIKEKKKYIKLLKDVLEEEIIEYAKLRGLSYTKIKKSDEKEFLDKLGNKHAETKFSLVKSVGVLREIDS